MLVYNHVFHMKTQLQTLSRDFLHMTLHTLLQYFSLGTAACIHRESFLCRRCTGGMRSECAASNCRPLIFKSHYNLNQQEWQLEEIYKDTLKEAGQKRRSGTNKSCTLSDHWTLKYQRDRQLRRSPDE